MNKFKRYIAVTLLLIGVISSSSISYANIFGWGEEIPASYNGGTQRNGDTYSIIPRVPGGGTVGNTTGIQYQREPDFDHPDDATKDIITSISYQVVSTSDYIYGRPTWRTARIYLYLSVYDPNTGQMIPLGFYIRPLPLQNITNATTQLTFNEEQVVQGYINSWKDTYSPTGSTDEVNALLTNLEDRIRQSFKFGCGLAVGVDIESMVIPNGYSGLVSDIGGHPNLLRLYPGQTVADRTAARARALQWAGEMGFINRNRFRDDAMTRIRFPEGEDPRCRMGLDLVAESIATNVTNNSNGTVTVDVRNIYRGDNLAKDEETKVLMTARNTAPSTPELRAFHGFTNEANYHYYDYPDREIEVDDNRKLDTYSFNVRQTNEVQYVELYLSVNHERTNGNPDPIEQDYTNNTQVVRVLIPPLPLPDLRADSITPTYNSTTGQLCATGVGSAVDIEPNNLVIPTDHVVTFSGSGTPENTTISNSTNTSLTRCINRPQTNSPQSITISYTINPTRSRPDNEATYLNNTITTTYVIPPIAVPPPPPVPDPGMANTCIDFENPPHPNKVSWTETRPFGDGTGQPSQIWTNIGDMCSVPPPEFATFEYIDNRPNDRNDMGEWTGNVTIGNIRATNLGPDPSCGCRVWRYCTDSDGDSYRCGCDEYRPIFRVDQAFDVRVLFRASMRHIPTMEPYSTTVNSPGVFKSGYGFFSQVDMIYFTDWDRSPTDTRAWIRRPNGTRPLYGGQDVIEQLERRIPFSWWPPEGTLGAGITPGERLREFYTHLDYPDGPYRIETWSEIQFGVTAQDCRYAQLQIQGNMWEDSFVHPSDPGRPTDGRGNQLGTDEWGKTRDWRFPAPPSNNRNNNQSNTGGSSGGQSSTQNPDRNRLFDGYDPHKKN